LNSGLKLHVHKTVKPGQAPATKAGLYGTKVNSGTLVVQALLTFVVDLNLWWWLVNAISLCWASVRSSLLLIWPMQLWPSQRRIFI